MRVRIPLIIEESLIKQIDEIAGEKHRRAATIGNRSREYIARQSRKGRRIRLSRLRRSRSHRNEASPFERGIGSEICCTCKQCAACESNRPCQEVKSDGSKNNEQLGR